MCLFVKYPWQDTHLRDHIQFLKHVHRYCYYDYYYCMLMHIATVNWGEGADSEILLLRMLGCVCYY